MSIIDVIVHDIKEATNTVEGLAENTFHVVEDVPNEVRHEVEAAIRTVEKLPGDFKKAVTTCPDFARKLVSAIQNGGVPASAYQPLISVPAERWNAAFSATFSDKELLENHGLAEAGDQQAQEKSKSALARVSTMFLGIGETGIAVATIILAAGLGMAALATPLAIPTLGIAEIPAIAVIVTGVIILIVAGGITVGAKIALAWLD